MTVRKLMLRLSGLHQEAEVYLTSHGTVEIWRCIGDTRSLNDQFEIPFRSFNPKKGE